MGRAAGRERAATGAADRDEARERGATAPPPERLRQVVIPNFVIGGAPRSGTTYLTETLDKHPDIAMAKPYVPEPKVMIAAAGGVDEDRARYEPLFEPADADRVRGEKTTLYFESDSVPGVFREVLPEGQMLFVVRDPVDRAYSNWLWSRKNELEDQSFEKAIELELAGTERQTRLPDWQHAYARPHDYLARGDYARFARRWIDALGPERVRFFLYEPMTGPGGDAVVADVQRWIGVEPRDLPRPTEFVTGARETGPPIADDVRDALRERMRPLVEEFAEVTGTDVSVWGY